MMDLLRQFFKFDKLMKDRLVAAFFFVGLASIILFFLSDLRTSFSVMGRHFFDGLILFVIAFFKILALFVTLRLMCELAIAIFHINNNLSPDGGKSEMAELDPVEAAREIAQKAAKTASSRTKTVVEKTRSRFSDDDEDDNADDVYPDYEDPTPPKRTRKKPAAKKPASKPAAKKPVAKKTATRKTTATKPAAKKTTTKKTATKKPARKVTPKK